MYISNKVKNGSKTRQNKVNSFGLLSPVTGFTFIRSSDWLNNEVTQITNEIFTSTIQLP